MNKTVLKVVRLNNEDVITASTLCDLNDGTHIYIGGTCPNDSYVHNDTTKLFNYKNGSWDENSESYLSSQYGSTARGWYHLENDTYKKCDHPAPEDEPTNCRNS